MVLRNLLFPKDGGGSLRRFLGMRQRLYKDQWNDSRPLRGPVPLFDFRRRDDAADLRDSLKPDRTRGLFGGWRVSDDSVIGGFSSSHMKFHEGENNLEEKSDGSSSSPPFLRWSGTLSTEINRQSNLARNVTRSGFAAVLSPEFPLTAPLENKYKALEICCRTDGRTYAVNLNVETYFPEDIYQGFIVGGDEPQKTNNSLEKPTEESESTSSTISSNEVDVQTPERPEPSLDVRQHLQNRRDLIEKTSISSDDHPYLGHPPSGFQKFVLPFKHFALTSRGRLRHAQRDLDGAISIESIGFTLMDGKDGDFCLDLVSLRAVNVLEGEVVGSLEDEAKEEKFQEVLRSGGEKKDDDSEAEKSDNKS
mmetsp:Transcript_16314/g.35246  ORF Transcript_16314/g.35246 Transcript_16314/m.35246 type:complete len:364 (-) Transcript_16314:544-1635(-)